MLFTVTAPRTITVLVMGLNSVTNDKCGTFINAHPWWGCLEANWDIIDEMKNVEVDR